MLERFFGSKTSPSSTVEEEKKTPKVNKTVEEKTKRTKQVKKATTPKLGNGNVVVRNNLGNLIIGGNVVDGNGNVNSSARSSIAEPYVIGEMVYIPLSAVYPPVVKNFKN